MKTSFGDLRKFPIATRRKLLVTLRRLIILLDPLDAAAVASGDGRRAAASYSWFWGLKRAIRFLANNT
jgi:hypothetical protein